MKTLIAYSHECGNDNSLDSYLKPGEGFVTTGLYLHGELEGLVGYDIVYVPVKKELYDNLVNTENNADWAEKKALIHKAVLEQIPYGINYITIMADGKEYQAMAYVYEDKYYSGVPDRLKGLVVLPKDVDGVKAAVEAYTAKTQTL